MKTPTTTSDSATTTPLADAQAPTAGQARILGFSDAGEDLIASYEAGAKDFHSALGKALKANADAKQVMASTVASAMSGGHRASDLTKARAAIQALKAAASDKR